MRYQAPRGTQDVVPEAAPKWVHLETAFRHLAGLYGYKEIRTPVFEDTDLFVRSSGETSDIVSKQMYTFLDKGDRSVTLKPEGTAPAIRAMLEGNLHLGGSVTRLAYVTQIFRYERPQKGRLRQAHQFGLELIGSPSPVAEAEIIEATVRFYESVGVNEIACNLNSLGRDACRAAFREAILAHAKSFLADQSEEFQAKTQKNPLRLLDSKDAAAQEMLKSLPPISAFWEDESKADFDRLIQLLEAANVPYNIDPSIVRGLDYYTGTVFEIQSTLLGAQSALCGGGRYDNLICDLGGPSTPAVGVGMGIERLIIVLEQLEKAWPASKPPIFVVSVGDPAIDATLKIARDLRNANLNALTDPDAKNMKSQMKQADRAGASHAVMVGENELAKGIALVKDLRNSQQSEVPLDALVRHFFEADA